LFIKERLTLNDLDGLLQGTLFRALYPAWLADVLHRRLHKKSATKLLMLIGRFPEVGCAWMRASGLFLSN